MLRPEKLPKREADEEEADQHSYIHQHRPLVLLDDRNQADYERGYTGELCTEHRERQRYIIEKRLAASASSDSNNPASS